MMLTDKYFLCLSGLFMFFFMRVNAQADFTGLVCYRITVEGAAEARTDSMWVVMDSSRVKITLFLPASEPGKPAVQKIFVDDLKRKKTYAWDSPLMNPKTDSLIWKPLSFENTHQYGALETRLGFLYKPSGTNKGNDQILASIDFGNQFIRDYAFLGYQPVLVDGRLVLEHIQQSANGQKPRVYVHRIEPMKDVREQFNLPGY